MIRKIAILVGFFAIALGAQAETVSYNFQLTVDGTVVGGALSYRSSVYLVDTANDNKIVAYMSRYNLNQNATERESASGEITRTWQLADAYVKHEAGNTAVGVTLGKDGKTITGFTNYSVDFGSGAYNILEHDLTSASIKNIVKGDATKTVVYSFDFETENRIVLGGVEGDIGGSTSLAAFLVDWNDDYSKTTYAKEIGNITWMSQAGITGDQFQISAYLSSVPEPTSGLLLLVGVAGLALRRRRAA